MRKFVVCGSLMAAILGSFMTLPDTSWAQGASELRLRRITFFNRFEQGRNYFQAQQYLEAAAYFRSLVTELQELPPFIQGQVRYYYGASLDELDVRTSAIALLDDVAGTEIPVNLWADAVARVVRGKRIAGDYTAADKYWSLAVNKVPSEKLLDPIRWEVILTLLVQDRREEILTLLEPITQRSQYFGPAQYLKGVVLQELQRTQAAMDVFQNLTRNRSELAFWSKEEIANLAQLAHARLLFDLGEYPRALVVYQRIDRGFSDRAQVLFEMAWCYAALEQYDAAVQQLAELISQHPLSPQADQSLLLSGYFRMQVKDFERSYATFEEAEKAYLALAQKLNTFVRQIPSKKLLGQTILSPSFRRLSFPQQVHDWIQQNESVALLEPVKASLVQIERALSSIQGDIEEVQILSASYGASYLNPLTIELRVRDDIALELANIQRNLLEKMVAPYRSQLRAKEYSLYNRSQQVLDELLQTNSEGAMTLRTQTIDRQETLREMADYLRLVAPEEFGLDPDPAVIGYETIFKNSDPLAVYRETLRQRQGLSGVLTRTSIDVDDLWELVLELVDQQHAIVQGSLIRLGVWNKRWELVELERMYTKVYGLQQLVHSLSKTLFEIREKVLVEVMDATRTQAKYVRQLEKLGEAYESMLDEQRYVAYADAARRVAFQVRETGINGTIGKLDLSWRIHKNEEQLHSSVLANQLERENQLKGNYGRIIQELDRPKDAKAVVLSPVVREQLGEDEESDELLKLIDEVGILQMQLDTSTYVKNELNRGTEALLHKQGTLRW